MTRLHWLLVLAGVLLVAFGALTLLQARRSMLAHEMSLALVGYRGNNQEAMPPTIDKLVDYMQSPPGHVNSGERKRWTQFAYVSGITTNDPPTTPAFFDVPDKSLWPWGLVSFYGGGSAWISDASLTRLLDEPWMLNSNDFRSAEALADFKRRARVIRPR